MPAEDKMQQGDGASTLYNMVKLAKLKHARDGKIEAVDALIRLSKGKIRGKTNVDPGNLKHLVIGN